MKLEDVQELHHITRMLNVASIMRRGLLSSEKAQSRSTRSFGTVEIGEDRQQRRSPTGIPLTQYVHLLMNARGPMWQKHLLRLPLDAATHVVIRVSPEVLGWSDTYVSAWNADIGERTFLPPQQSLALLDPEVIGSKWWNEDKEIERQLMTQVIVPDKVAPE